MTKMNVYIFAPGANMITRVQFAGVGERDGAKKKMSFVRMEKKEGKVRYLQFGTPF